jgi:hypothetical protein
MNFMENEKVVDFDHEIRNLVEKKCRHSINPGQNPERPQINDDQQC